jgi:hypothetical protein
MNDLLDLQAGQWKLHVYPGRRLDQLLTACAYLAERGPLVVLDCDRQYNPAVVVQAAGGRAEVTDRILSQRAFICYEVVRLLQRTAAGEAPILVLGLLASFYDENVPLNMRHFLLGQALLHVQRLSRNAGLAVFVGPPPNAPEALHLFERLAHAAPQVVTYEPAGAQPAQPRLL